MKPRNRSRIFKSVFNYQQMESRQMLANFAQVDGGVTISDALNLIQNGNFSSAVNGVQSLYADSDVAGWTASNSTNPPVSDNNKIKILTLATASRGNVVNLDAIVGQRDGIFQTITTPNSAKLLLTFDIAKRAGATGADAATNDVEVFWNGASQGVFSPETGWRTIKLVVNALKGSETQTSVDNRLEFREAAAANSAADDGVGPLLDNVRMTYSSTSIAVNGSFENVPTGTGDVDKIVGWSAMGEDSVRTLKVIEGTSKAGTRHLNVDGSASNIDRVYQDIKTDPNSLYLITLYSKRTGTTADADNELRIRWNNSWVATLSPTQDWEGYQFIVNSTSALSRLVIREPGPNFGDGTGPLIDSLTVFRLGDLPNFDANGSAAGINSTAIFTEDAGPTGIIPATATLQSSLSSSMSGAVLTLTNAPDGSSESLSADTSTTAISASYSATTRQLTLSGIDTIQNYQKVLRTVKYNNTSQAPDTTSRIVNVVVSNYGILSQTSVVTINIVGVNDTPAIDPIADAIVTSGGTFSKQVVASDIDSPSFTYSMTTSNKAGSNTLETPSISSTGLITWSPTQTGSYDVLVKVTDSSGGISEEGFKLSSVANGDIPSNFVPFSGTRQLSNVDPAKRNQIYTAAPTNNLDLTKTYQARIETDHGDIVLNLHDNLAPVTVNNFIKLANDGFYDGLSFHRVIDGFVAQGGDPLGTGGGGPGYSFADEFDSSLTFAGTGVLAMANSGVNTNGSQFFITYTPQTQLTNKHSIFGQVVGGTNALNAIVRAVPGNGIAADIIRKITIIVT